MHGSNFYRPFTLLYQRLMNSMIGISAWGWHAGSVLLNLLCVLLVFALARQLLRTPPTAFFAAALYAVHPTHVEAVTWISAAGDPLMTVFVLAAAVAFLHWRNGESAAWLAAALAAGAAALLTKDMAVVLPALLSAFLLLPAAARRWRTPAGRAGGLLGRGLRLSGRSQPYPARLLASAFRRHHGRYDADLAGSHRVLPAGHGVSGGDDAVLCFRTSYTRRIPPDSWGRCWR